MGLTLRSKGGIEYKFTGTIDRGTRFAKDDGHAPRDYASGTSDWQADKIFADTRTLAASANETLDLSSLTDPLGAALAFVEVVEIFIKAADANTNNVVVGAAGSNPFLAGLGGTTPTVAIPPGGVLHVSAPKGGWAVSTAVNLKIANSGSGTGVTYDIVIVGRSA